jgi:hypothetical protein
MVKREFVEGWSGTPGCWEARRTPLTDWLITLLLRLHFALGEAMQRLCSRLRLYRRMLRYYRMRLCELYRFGHQRGK